MTKPASEANFPSAIFPMKYPPMMGTPTQSPARTAMCHFRVVFLISKSSLSITPTRYNITWRKKKYRWQTLIGDAYKRDASIEYIKSTSDDLRNHYNDFPFGKFDTYQTI